MGMVEQYFAAIWSDWIARMSGIASLIFTILGVYSDTFVGIPGANRARLFLWASAILCFLVANYRIWLDEHKKRVAGEPKFSMTIESMHYEFQPTNDKTVIIVAIYLLNQGAASITRAWRGFYEVGSSVEQMQLIYIQKWTIRSANEFVNLSSADQITAKTSEQRLETGEAKMGRLFFTLAGDRTDQIRGLHFRLRVICHDFLGAPSTAMFAPSATPLIGVPIYPNEMGEILSAEPVEGILGVCRA
jgi:hypothetical protein